VLERTDDQRSCVRGGTERLCADGTLSTDPGSPPRQSIRSGYRHRPTGGGYCFETRRDLAQSPGNRLLAYLRCNPSETKGTSPVRARDERRPDARQDMTAFPADIRQRESALRRVGREILEDREYVQAAAQIHAAITLRRRGSGSLRARCRSMSDSTTPLLTPAPVFSSPTARIPICRRSAGAPGYRKRAPHLILP